MSSTGPVDKTGIASLEFFKFPEELKIKSIPARPELTTSYVEADGKAVSMPPRPGLDAPVLDIEDMTRALMELQSKLMDEQVKFSKEDIKTNMAEKKELHQQRLQAIQNALNKMSEAKKAGTWGKVFGWIGSAAAILGGITTVAIGAALIATGAGSVVGALLIASGAMAIAAGTVGLVTTILDTAGVEMPNEVRIALTAVMVLLSLGSAVTGIAGGIGIWAAGISIAEVVGSLPQYFAAIAQIMGGLSMIGQGGAQIATAIYTKESEDERARSQDMQAFMKKLQMLLEDEMERIKDVLKKMEEGVSMAMQIMSEQQDTKALQIKQMV